MKNTKTALQIRSYINAETKNTDYRSEYGMIYQTNKNRGFYYSQEALLNLYNENNFDDNGCSKMVFLHNAETKKNFKYIVIKRMRTDFVEGKYLRGNNNNNNQVADELKMFLELEKTENKFFNLLNPILRYDTVKSDHNDSESKKSLQKYIIICQKATDIGNWQHACKRAKLLNQKANLIDKFPYQYNKGLEFAEAYNMQDIIYNIGNSGVIFDIINNCYKAVFIDYAR